MEETDLHAFKWVDSEKAASSASSSKSSPQHLHGHPRPTGPSPRWMALRRHFLDDRVACLSNTCIILVILFCIARIATHISIQFASQLSLSEAERIILNSPSPDFIRNQSYIYTSGAHLAGKNKTQAIYTRDLWESYGIKTEIETYEVLLSYPVSHHLALLHNGTVEFEAALREDVIPENPTSLDPDQVPTFHGYSANGNVTGELVYANLGNIDDFEVLVKHGVNVSGKIVIVRYGDTFRGLKVKAAQDYGAIGVIIYSDPKEDGDLAATVPYPHGPGRHPSAVQRGSVQFLSLLPGDPSTPGYASKPGVNRTDPHDYIPSIPSLLISYRDALPLLKSLNGGILCGLELGSDWRGGLDGVSYCLENPSKPSTVNLVNNVQYVYTPIYNVIGRIPGWQKEEIILGTHRDAWVNGAGDSVSDSAPFNAVVRGFGDLLKQGWKPLRTLVFASWDAEKHGLVGSTEWVEDHAKHIRKETLAYLNVDVGVVGDSLHVASSPLLDAILVLSTKDIVTNTGDTILENWRNTSNGKPEIDVLGSGSDYTGFLQFMGVPSCEFGFSNRKPVYQYQSNYDSFYWMDTFGDPGWFHHQQIAQMWGLTALRLASYPTIPFTASAYTHKLGKYVDSLGKEALSVVDGDMNEVKKRINLDPLERAISQLSKYARKLDEKADDLEKSPYHRVCYFGAMICLSRPRKVEIDRVNEAYFEFERIFIGKGLPGRPFFKHVVYAPGVREGYAGLSFPSIREAITGKRWQEARDQIKEITQLLNKVTSKAAL